MQATAHNSVLVLIPMHQSTLKTHELFSLTYSLDKLQSRSSCFIIPKALDISWLHSQFPHTGFIRFDNQYFNSVEDYSRLLVSRHFYEMFLEYEFILILQTDAIIFRDELDHWCGMHFDYIGAPWFDGYEFSVNVDQFGGNKGRNVRMHVGNGGLSLRRVKKCVSLIKEFPNANSAFIQTGSNEDFFFGLLGGVSKDFILPNEITASLFSMEHRPDYYYDVNGNNLPMGAHGWDKIQKEFWLKHFPSLKRP